MTRTHTHPCERCRKPIECSGYPVAHDGGKHCIHDEDDNPWLCEDCRDDYDADDDACHRADLENKADKE